MGSQAGGASEKSAGGAGSGQLGRAAVLLRPLSVTAGAVFLFVAWSWIGMSDADYRPGSRWGGRTTAGWFWLGLPFLLLVGLLSTLPFSWIARRRGPGVGWLCLLTAFVPLLAVACILTTPMARLRAALGTDPPDGTEILRLRQIDSFNDGNTVTGVCSAGPEFVSRLTAAHGLRQADVDPGRFDLSGVSLPAAGQGFLGEGLTVFHDADRSQLWFQRRPAGRGR
ncbi:MAG: hypothetical protein KF774_19220 [Planctomyces sp.]|nr:hypothetical protein [Planctomyces sp.]